MATDNPLHRGPIASAIFFPRPDMPHNDSPAGARDHLFELAPRITGRLRLFFGEPDWPVILFFHGNGETARDYDGLADAYHEIKASLVVGEYRGYGPCNGEPSLGTILPDALSSLNTLLELMASENRTGPLLVMGRSLGSAPAIELAANRADAIAGLIVESGFAYTLPLLELIGIPVKELGIEESHGPMNLDKMSKIEMPTLVIHAEQDMIIPIRDGEALAAGSADTDRDFLSVPGAGHNDIQMAAGVSYFERIETLVSRVLASR